MKNAVEIADEVSNKIATLATRYRDLKQTVAKLEAENQKLVEENKQLANEYSEIKAKFDIFRLSVAVSNKSTENTDAKKRIDQLVREIDKCIALLN